MPRTAHHDGPFRGIDSLARAVDAVAVRGRERLPEPYLLDRVRPRRARQFLYQRRRRPMAALLRQPGMSRLSCRAGGHDPRRRDPQRLARSRERGHRRDHRDDLVVAQPRHRTRDGDRLDVTDQGAQRIELRLKVGEE